MIHSTNFSPRYEQHHDSINHQKQQKRQFKKGISYYHTYNHIQQWNKIQTTNKKLKGVFFKQSKATSTHTHPNNTIFIQPSNRLGLSAYIIPLICSISVVSAQALSRTSQTPQKFECQLYQNDISRTNHFATKSSTYPTDDVVKICETVDRSNQKINQLIKNLSYTITDIVALPNATEDVVTDLINHSFHESGMKLRTTLIPPLSKWFNYTLGERCYEFSIKEETQDSFGNRIAQTSLKNLYENFDFLDRSLSNYVLYAHLSRKEIKDFKAMLSDKMQYRYKDLRERNLKPYCNNPTPPIPSPSSPSSPISEAAAYILFTIVAIVGLVGTLGVFVAGICRVARFQHRWNRSNYSVV